MTSKQITISALKQYKGDDLYRATRAFAGYSKNQMQEQHGQSGQTRQEILDGYQKHADACDVALAWIQSFTE